MAITSAVARVNSPIVHRLLSIDGKVWGVPANVTGGSIYADFVTEKIGPDHLARKHLSGVKYEDISLEVGTGMIKEFYGWIQETLQGKYSRKNGEITVCDFDFVPRGALSFSYALISEVSFPKLDAAAKDAAKLTVKLKPELLRSNRNPPKPGSKIAAPPAQKEKKWLPANFRLEIDGLDCKYVNRVSPPVARQIVAENAVGELRDYQKEPSHWEFGNLTVTLAETHADSWVKWHDDFVIHGNNGEGQEKTGTLTYLASDMKTELFVLKLSHLGIFRLHEEAGESGAEKVQRVEAEMYCERMELEKYGPAK
jgi:hypothetical protein